MKRVRRDGARHAADYWRRAVWTTGGSDSSEAGPVSTRPPCSAGRWTAAAAVTPPAESEVTALFSIRWLRACQLSVPLRLGQTVPVGRQGAQRLHQAFPAAAPSEAGESPPPGAMSLQRGHGATGPAAGRPERSSL